MFMIDFTEVIGYLSKVFQADNLIILDVLPKLECALTALVEMKSSPGKCVSSLTKGSQFGKVILKGEVKPELNTIHQEILDSAIEQIDKRFSGLQKPPLSVFSVLDYTLWPYDLKELATFGKEKVINLVKQFSPLLSEEEVNAIPREWLNFKLHVRHLRTNDLK